MANEETDVAIKYGADVSQVTEGMTHIGVSITQLRELLQGTLRPLYAVRENLGAAAEAFAAFFIVDKAIHFVDVMAELGEKTERVSQIFGISTEDVGLLGFAATQTGGNMESLVRSLERMSLSMQQAQDKANPISIALKALGLNAKELSNLPLVDMLDRLRGKYSGLADGQQKVAIAQLLVRNGAETLLPILRMSNEQWQQLSETFDKTGAKMDAVTTEKLAHVEKSMHTLNESMMGLGITIISAVAPAIEALVQGVTKLVQGFNEELQSNSLAQFALDAFVFALKLAVVGVLTLTTAFAVLWQVASGIIKGLGDGLGNLAAALVKTIQGDFQGALARLSGGWLQLGADAKESAEAIKGVLVGYKDMLAILVGADTHPLEITVGGKGRGGALDFNKEKKNDAFNTALIDSQKQLSALQAQIVTLNMGTEAAAAYTEQQRLRAIAVANGIKLTERDNIAIQAQAQAIGQATAQLEHQKAIQQSLQDLAQGITEAFGEWLNGTDSLGHAFLKLAAQMALAVAQALLLDLILSALGLALPAQGLGAVFAPMFGGNREKGGPLEMGKWYIAGEHGPEPVWGGGPGAFAQGYQQQQQQPSANITFAPTIHAMDAAGVDRVLSAHGERFAKTVQQHFDRQPSLRPGSKY